MIKLEFSLSGSRVTSNEDSRRARLVSHAKMHHLNRDVVCGRGTRRKIRGKGLRRV